MRRLPILIVLLFAIYGSVSAQPKKVIADKIVAQVGDKIILRSDIYNAIADYKRQGVELPPNAECEFIEGQLIQKALVLQAEKDSLSVSEEELDALLENQIRGFIQMYGSKEMLEEIAGKSIFQLKEDFREAFRERKLADQMRNKIVDNVKITPTEVRAYFNKIPKDSLPFYESELQLSQIVFYPKPHKDVEEYESNFLMGLKRQVEAGKKFEMLAKAYSQDPGSKDNGGQYTVNRTDKMWDPTFIREAFKLKDGQMSNPVKTKFGVHLIQMVSRAGDEAIVRHILRIPEVGKAEVDLSKKKMDSIRGLIVNKQISFRQAVGKYTESEDKFNNGSILAKDGSSYVTIDQLDKDIVLAIKDLKPGSISQPIAFTDERGKQAVRIVFYETRTEPHLANLKDDYNRIAERALEIKKMQALEKWFKDRIPTYYITIDKEFSGCNNITDWHKAAASK
ncbi:MAG: peptidylprolyl isomerase [Chitinophagaceae bacterium]|jgi:peptidyl-prolyl cis-trans isomerase SurA|nr:peptidylprolyl isomerase [Chitinophagaceae bacterium]